MQIETVLSGRSNSISLLLYKYGSKACFTEDSKLVLDYVFKRLCKIHQPHKLPKDERLAENKG